MLISGKWFIRNICFYFIIHIKDKYFIYILNIIQQYYNNKIEIELHLIIVFYIVLTNNVLLKKYFYSII